MTSINDLMQVLRVQPWERAKGEMSAMLQTYYPVYDKDGKNTSRYDEIRKEIEDFVKRIEDNYF